MDMRVDPRLRPTPSPGQAHGPTPATSATSPSPADSHPSSHLPSLPRPSLAENPVRLPPLSDSPSQSPYYQLPPTSQSQFQSQPQSQSQAHPQDQSASQLSNGDPNASADPKRPRACESCRGLKVRCESDVKNPEGPCKRCAKAGRSCVVTVPSRKRQKKSDSRVAELERKIDALTASLHATKSGTHLADSDTDSYSHNGDDHDDSRADDGETNHTSPSSTKPPRRAEAHGYHQTSSTPHLPENAFSAMLDSEQRKRKFTQDSSLYLVPSDSKDSRTPGQQSTPSAERSSAGRDDPPSLYPFLMPKSRANISAARSPDGLKSPQFCSQPTNDYADVIDRRMLSADDATAIFDVYVKHMTCFFPAVVFPKDTSAAEIRKTKPTLFLAILSCASGTFNPDLQRSLTKELMKILAERIICNGEKSLEIVQALHVATLFYWPPEHHDELKFYQLIHIAAVMAIDIGLGKKHKPMKKKFIAGLWRDHPWWKRSNFNPESAEARRSWLSCYYLSATASQSLRRPNLIRWTSYMDDCIESLTTGPDALYTDKVLCQWIKLQHIADEVAYQFSMDDPWANVTLADMKVQYALKNFERQLSDWNARLPPELDNPSLRFSSHVLDIYIHEIAMHVDHNIDDFHPPFTEETLKSSQYNQLTPTHIDALTSCLSAIHRVFDIFCGYETDAVQRLPTHYHVRAAYTVIVLVKMYFAAVSPTGELGKVIAKEDMKVELSLDRLLAKYRLAAEDDRSKPAAKFLGVLVMLKTWFQKQEYGYPADKKATINCGAAYPGMSAEGCSRKRAWLDTAQNEQTKTAARSATPNSAYSQTPGATDGSQYPETAEQSVGRGDGNNRMQLDYSSANTPLQLLSEVAMGNSNGMGDTSMANVMQGNSWYNYNNPDGTAYSANPQTQLGDGTQMAPASFMPGEPGFGNDMGDVFGQAMGMTLGDGDFTSIFMNDLLFNMNMDGSPNAFENLV